MRCFHEEELGWGRSSNPRRPLWHSGVVTAVSGRAGGGGLAVRGEGKKPALPDRRVQSVDEKIDEVTKTSETGLIITAVLSLPLGYIRSTRKMSTGGDGDDGFYINI